MATGAQLERICRRYRSFAAEGGVPGLEPAALDPSCDERGVRVWTTDAGHMRIEVTLDASDATLVLAAIDKVRDELRAVTGSTNRVSAETRGGLNDATPMPGRLDGVIAIAERTLAPTPQTADFSDGAPVPQHQVVIHLDQSVLEPEGARDAYLEDGTRVSAETFRRVSCDSALVAVTTGAAGEVLDVGRKTRAVPTAIRRALWSRDRGCRFPMCTARRFVHAHHVRHWAHGGPTRLDNLVLLCSFHHRLLHEGGFKVSIEADASPRFFGRAGREIAPVPAAPPTVGPPVRTVSDPDVNLCRWDGEPVNYGDIVDAICMSEAHSWGG